MAGRRHDRISPMPEVRELWWFNWLTSAVNVALLFALIQLPLSGVTVTQSRSRSEKSVLRSGDDPNTQPTWYSSGWPASVCT